MTVGSCAFGPGALSLAFPGFARFVGALRNPSVGEWFLLIPLFCLSDCQIVFVCTVYPGLCVNTYIIYNCTVLATSPSRPVKVAAQRSCVGHPLHADRERSDGCDSGQKTSDVLRRKFSAVVLEDRKNRNLWDISENFKNGEIRL